MKIAYADPPYLGMGKRYPEHPESRIWDDPQTHKDLLFRLDADYDGWAYSLSSPSILSLAQYAPVGTRVGSWVKPFCAFKPGVNPAYAWEPIFFKPARRLGRDVPTERDWVSANITLRRGCVGAKPEAVCRWMFQIIGAQPDDEFSDLFPGSGAVSVAWDAWRKEKAA